MAMDPKVKGILLTGVALAGTSGLAAYFTAKVAYANGTLDGVTCMSAVTAKHSDNVVDVIDGNKKLGDVLNELNIGVEECVHASGANAARNFTLGRYDESGNKIIVSSIAQSRAPV